MPRARPRARQVLPYDTLMAQLDLSSVRALEDLLINDCIYAGIVKGKLDQRQHCFEVRKAAQRRPVDGCSPSGGLLAHACESCIRSGVQGGCLAAEERAASHVGFPSLAWHPGSPAPHARTYPLLLSLGMECCQP